MADDLIGAKKIAALEPGKVLLDPLVVVEGGFTSLLVLVTAIDDTKEL